MTHIRITQIFDQSTFWYSGYPERQKESSRAKDKKGSVLKLVASLGTRISSSSLSKQSSWRTHLKILLLGV